MKISKRIFTALISVFFFFLWPPSATNCIDEGSDPESTRVWLFLPKISNISSLYNFTYTFDDQHQQGLSWYDQNIEEWNAVVGKQVKAADIDKILYWTDPEDYFNKDYDQSNTFMARLESSDLAAVKTYLDFSKNCESLMSTPGFYDDEERWTMDGLSSLQEVIAYGNELIEKTDNSWVKVRLAYQLTRLDAHLTGGIYEDEIIEKYIDNSKHTESWIVGSLKLNQLLREEDQIKKNYLLVKAYLDYPSEKERIIRNFDRTLKAETLQLAKGKKEKALIEFIACVNYSGRTLTEMKYSYRLNPHFKELRFLISKEVNKLEDWILSPVLIDPNVYANESYGYDNDARDFRVKPENQKERIITDLNYLGEVLDFIDKVIKDNQQADLYFWKLTASYLSFMQGDFIKARIYLNSITAENIPVDTRIQMMTTGVLISVFENETLTEKAKYKIFELFEFIDAQENKVDFYNFKSELAFILSSCLIKRGYKTEGLLMLARSSKSVGSFCYSFDKAFYHKMLDIYEPDDFKRTLQVLTKPASPFEEWLGTYATDYEVFAWRPQSSYDVNWDIDRIRNYYSTILIMQQKFWEATEILEELPADRSQLTYTQNPFSSGLFTMEEEDIDSTTTQYSKLYLAKGLALRDEKTAVLADQGQRQALYFQMANAYYNLSYYGRWWLSTYPAKCSDDIEYAYQEYVQNRTRFGEHRPSETPPIDPGYFLTLGLLGLIVTGIAYKKNRFFYSRLGLLLSISSFIFVLSCTKTNQEDETEKRIQRTQEAERTAEGETLIPPFSQTINYKFYEYYFEAEKALEHYQICKNIDPNSTIGIAADYMIHFIKDNREAAFSNIAINFRQFPEKGKRSAHAIDKSVSCAGFAYYLSRRNIDYKKR